MSLCPLQVPPDHSSVVDTYSSLRLPAYRHAHLHRFHPYPRMKLSKREEVQAVAAAGQVASEEPSPATPPQSTVAEPNPIQEPNPDVGLTRDSDTAPAMKEVTAEDTPRSGFISRFYVLFRSICLCGVEVSE